MKEGLFGFLKYVGSFPKFLRSIYSIVYPALYHLLAHQNLQLLKFYHMFSNKTRYFCLWHLNVPLNLFKGSNFFFKIKFI